MNTKINAQINNQKAITIPAITEVLSNILDSIDLDISQRKNLKPYYGLYLSFDEDTLEIDFDFDSVHSVRLEFSINHAEEFLSNGMSVVELSQRKLETVEVTTEEFGSVKVDLSMDCELKELLEDLINHANDYGLIESDVYTTIDLKAKRDELEDLYIYG